jgi:hypothetical protein
MRFHSIIAAVSLVFAGLFSQAPEFTQQYYQRIGGAIDELQRGRQQFDENARRLGHDRESALGIMSNDPQPLVQGLAQIEKDSATRLEQLKIQQTALRDAGSLDRTLYLLGHADKPLAAATWQAFEPAIPLTQAGIGFAIGGFILSFLLLSGLTLLLRRSVPATA